MSWVCLFVLDGENASLGRKHHQWDFRSVTLRNPLLAERLRGELALRLLDLHGADGVSVFRQFQLGGAVKRRRKQSGAELEVSFAWVGNDLLVLQKLADRGQTLSGHLDLTVLTLLDRKSTRLTPVTNAHLVCRLLLEKKKT